MDSKKPLAITVEVEVMAPMEKVWKAWTAPEHITCWNFAADEWHCPSAINELRPDGRFSWRMEAKDGSAGFDYSGVYQSVVYGETITAKLDDGRNVQIVFQPTDQGVRVIETFEIENENSKELQQAGWQSILNNYKKHAESI